MDDKIKFYKTPLEKEMLIAKLQRHPTLYKIFKRKKYLTKEINDDINKRQHGQMDSFCVILIEGTQGGMKSSVAQEISTSHDLLFDVKKISFLYNDFREKLEQSKKGEWYILDEEVFLSGIGSGRILESLMTCIETLRQHGANLIIISPNPKYFPEHIFTHHLEAIDKCILGTCEQKKELHEIRTCESEKHENINATVRCAIKKDKEYIGFYLCPITGWNSQLWQEYQLVKKEFMKQVLKENFQKTDYTTIATDIVQNPKSEQYKTAKQIMLYLEQNHPNFTVGEKNLIVEEIKIRRRMRDQTRIDGMI